jgi:hypothetical protein
MADAGGFSPLPQPLQILAQWTPTAEAIIVQAELPNGSMNLCALLLVKQDRENALFHVFDLEDRSERSA